MSEKSAEKRFIKWRFIDIMFSHSGLQNGKCLKDVIIFRFEVRRNRKKPYGVIVNVLRNGYLGFSIFIDFHPPPDSKFEFSKKIVFKVQNLQDIKKRKICYQDTYTQHV